MKSKELIISTVMTALLCLASINTAYAEETYKANRLGGQDRIETSVKIATNYNDGQLQAVVVTTANDFPEALTGSTLAAKCKAPILLVNQTAQNSQGTLAYIKGHLSSNGTVYILGQTTSVSTDVENAIRNMGYTNIKRLAGTNKEETLKIINNEVNVSTGTPVFIASGDNFPEVKENNPKTLVAEVNTQKSYAKATNKENFNPYAAAYKNMPKFAQANPNIKLDFILVFNGILQNGMKHTLFVQVLKDL